MARDRLAAMRAQQATPTGFGAYDAPTPPYDSYASPAAAPYAPAPEHQQQYEMKSVEATGSTAVNFLNEITELQTTLAAVDANIAKIADAHSRSLNGADEAASAAAEAELVTLTSQTRGLTNATKTRIQVLATRANNLPAGKEKNMQESQLAAIKRRFKDSIRRYQQLENDYQRKYRARAERQFLIVNPQATQGEIDAAMDDAPNGQLFSQALLSSNRHGQATSALREVQDRHAEIKKIEQTMAELAQLFNDVDILLTEQDEQIDVVAGHGQDVERHMNQGLDSTKKAVVSARKARKKRWICFWITVVLIIIILAVVLGAVCGSGACSSNHNNDNSKNNN